MPAVLRGAALGWRTAVGHGPRPARAPPTAAANGLRRPLPASAPQSDGQAACECRQAAQGPERSCAPPARRSYTSPSCGAAAAEADSAATAGATRGASRRSLLAAAAATVSAAAGSRPSFAADEDGLLPPASSDLVTGTARLAGLGAKAVEVQLQGGGSEAPAVDEEDLEAWRRSFGIITIPGLSSFSFVHGLLVGCAALAFAWTFSGGSGEPGSGASSGASSRSSSPGEVRRGWASRLSCRSHEQRALAADRAGVHPAAHSTTQLLHHPGDRRFGAAALAGGCAQGGPLRCQRDLQRPRGVWWALARAAAAPSPAPAAAPSRLLALLSALQPRPSHSAHIPAPSSRRCSPPGA